jgi:hypothetical protein
MEEGNLMRLLVTNPLARDALGGLILLGMMMVLVGVVHLVSALLGGRKWLPGPIVKYVLPALLFAGWVAVILATNIFSGVNTFPSRSSSPLLMLVLFSLLYGILYPPFYTLSAQMLRVLSARPPVTTGPLMKWRRVAWMVPSLLSISLLIGLIAGTTTPDSSARSLFYTVPLPLVGWRLQLFWPLLGLQFSGLIVVVAASLWLARQFGRLPASRFGQIGALLLGLGSAVLVLACLLVP